MKPLSASLLLFILLMIGCKKEVDECPQNTKIVDVFTNDTIYPSPYLMTYPGSWWEYNNGYIDTCKMWEPVPFSHISNGECAAVQKEYCLLSVLFNNNYIYEDGLVINAGSTEYETEVAPLFAATPQVLFDKGFTYSGGESVSTTKITSKGHYDSLTINGTKYYDVMATEVYSSRYFTKTGATTSTTQTMYFAKNRGIVARYQLMNGFPVQSDTVNVVNYYIAPH